MSNYYIWNNKYHNSLGEEADSVQKDLDNEISPFPPTELLGYPLQISDVITIENCRMSITSEGTTFFYVTEGHKYNYNNAYAFSILMCNYAKPEIEYINEPCKVYWAKSNEAYTLESDGNIYYYECPSFDIAPDESTKMLIESPSQDIIDSLRNSNCYWTNNCTIKFRFIKVILSEGEYVYFAMPENLDSITDNYTDFYIDVDEQETLFPILNEREYFYDVIKQERSGELISLNEHKEEKIIHRNKIKIAAAVNEREADAINALEPRELLYNKDTKTLGIILEDENGEKYKQNVTGLTSVDVDDNNIEINNKGEISLKDNITIDSVTAQADHEGIDWKSQSRIAETTAARTVILLCGQDINMTEGLSVVGGELLEVGEGIYGHYQISLTSTGSRLLKGATTNQKKAKLVSANYNGKIYYGIKFKSAIPAKIYFAGWTKISANLAAPNYSTYNDGDLSEVIELDDDSDTGIEVIEYNLSGHQDINWEFKNNKSPDFSVNPSQSGSGTDLLYDWGNGFSMYPNQGNKTQVRIERGWQSVIVSGVNAIVWRIEIDSDNANLSLRVKNWNNNRSCNIVLYGSNEDGSIEYRVLQNAYVQAGSYFSNGETVTFSNIKKGVYWIRQGDGQNSTQIEYYPMTVTQTFVSDSAEWNDGGDNSGFNLGDGLIMLTSNNTTYYSGQRLNDYGYIQVDGSTDWINPLAKLTVEGPCTITVGCSRVASSGTCNLTITESLLSNDLSVTKSLTNSTLTDVVYNYNGEDNVKKDIYLINTNSIYCYYIRVAYPDASNRIYEIGNIIEGLANTGEYGAPHTIRLSGSITKENILYLASLLKNPSKQINLDLSDCYGRYADRDWGADTDGLNNAFDDCVSLREFYYPSNVTTTGGNTFKNCSSLRKVVLSETITHIGAPSDVWSWENNALFTGTRVKSLFIPSSVNSFGGYPFSHSNIVNLFFERDSAFVTGGTFGQWNTFAETKESLRLRCPEDLYTKWKNDYTTFQSYGADGDGVEYISTSCYRRDHVLLWNGTKDDIDYTADYSLTE